MQLQQFPSTNLTCCLLDQNEIGLQKLFDMEMLCGLLYQAHMKDHLRISSDQHEPNKTYLKKVWSYLVDVASLSWSDERPEAEGQQKLVGAGAQERVAVLNEGAHRLGEGDMR